MVAKWKGAAAVESGQRLAEWGERTQAKGQALAELQRRMADRADGLRRLQEDMRRALEIARGMVGRVGDR